MASNASSTLRDWSVSSIRTMNLPPVCLANSQLNRAVLMFPIWGYPVGLGAKRVRTADMAAEHTSSGPNRRTPGILRPPGIPGLDCRPRRALLFPLGA